MKNNPLVHIFLPLCALVFLVFTLVSVTKNRVPKPRDATVEPPSAHFQHKIAGLGIVESETRNIEIGSHSSGVVSKIYVHEGDLVNKGDPLFSIDDSEIKAEIDHARAKLAITQIHYEDISHNLNLFESIKDKRAISYSELSSKRFAAKKAHAQMIEAKTHLKVVESRFKKLTAKSPVDGHILQINAKIGEFLNNNNTPPIVLGHLGKMRVRVEIDETDIHRVDQDAKAIGMLRGNSQVKIPLKFLKYAPYIMPKSNLSNRVSERIDTRVIELVYGFDNSQASALPGQRMDVFIEETR